MDTIEVTTFIRPNGRKVVSRIPKVYPDDAKFINEHKIRVSMEDCGFDYAIWFNDGKMKEDDPTEPDEITILAQGRTCEDCLAEGVRMVKERNANMK